MIRLTVDDRRVEVPEGSSLLDAAERAGSKVPTLCHHKALLPYGACRLCLVEVDVPGRATSVQASCTYPASEGLVVRTDTPRLSSARRIVAELLLARCDAPAIRRAAAALGVTETRVGKKDDDCVYCGLCVRMCEERMGRAAVGFSGRGPRRKVEPPYGEHNDACWTCRACDFVCPTDRLVSRLTSGKAAIPIPHEFEWGMTNRSAISFLYPQMVPNRPAIDARTCVHLAHGECGVCEAVCGADAIRFDDRDREVPLEVGAVVLAPGCETYDAGRKAELGHGRFQNVLTAPEFERMLSASGPFGGHVVRPSDHGTPTRIAFIQCVGSRDAQNDWCSSVCCMYATKQALLAKEHVSKDLGCDVYMMDMRAFGKGFDEFYERAKREGVEYLRCRPRSVEEVAESGRLRIEYLVEDDRKERREYDLVVLSVGLTPPEATRTLAEAAGLRLDATGFAETAPFRPVETPRPGVYVAGAFTGPRDIPESVVQGSAAAAHVLADLRAERFTRVAKREYPPETDVAGQEPRIGVFVCHCGINIAGVVNVREVAEYATTLPGVVHAECNLYTCSTDTQGAIKARIREHGLNRVVVASCTPRTHEPLFRDTIREGGLNPYLFEMANIRDQCSWVHRDHPVEATKKAKDLVRMAVAKARLIEPLVRRSIAVRKSALVVGGGVAGMTAANALADEGYEVVLVEKEATLGGNLKRIHRLIDGTDAQKELAALVLKTTGHPRIRVHTSATLEAVEGCVGDFTSTIVNHGGPSRVAHGVVVVATGASEHRPTQYLYGQDERVLTQSELEARLENGTPWPKPRRRRPPTVVMIQCVGSRDAERPYCSRICCTEAIKNALAIKERHPETAVYVLYRDVRVYGLKERYYTQARKAGVAFVRWEADKPPVVSKNGGATLDVEVLDRTLDLPIRIAADLVVLSAGITRGRGEDAVAKLLKVPVGADGFFLEAHLKLRPVDFATPGVFVCGLAHAAKSVDESVAQAQAAAARAAAILSKDRVELDANISEVDYDACDGCGYCVDPCPVHALTLFEFAKDGSVKKAVDVDEAACLGCGSCQATCPKGGIRIRGFTMAQLQAQVHALLEVPS